MRREKEICCEKNSSALRLHITGRGVELLDPKNEDRRTPFSELYGETSHEKATDSFDASGSNERIARLLRLRQSICPARLLRSGAVRRRLCARALQFLRGWRYGARCCDYGSRANDYARSSI